MAGIRRVFPRAQRTRFYASDLPQRAWKQQLLDAVPEVLANGVGRKRAKEHEAKIHNLQAKIIRELNRDHLSLRQPRPSILSRSESPTKDSSRLMQCYSSQCKPHPPSSHHQR